MCVFGNAVENYYDVIFMNESSEKINFFWEVRREEGEIWVHYRKN